MILQKAKNELLEERRKELRNREDHIKKQAPPFDIDGLNQSEKVFQVTLRLFNVVRNMITLI